MAYQFKDTDLAARRLKYLAAVFKPAMRAFVLDALADLQARPQIVLDLGCGPGYTTHYLAQLTQCRRAIGLDNSAHFISLAESLAEQTRTDQVAFCRHDLTTLPFPVDPSDFAYCRYLLTHLRDPAKLINQWGTQLRPEGLLLIEETEWIETKGQVFKTYLEIVEQLLANQGTQLYLGPALNALQQTESLIRRSSRVIRRPVLTYQAATMFYMNIQTWKHQPFIQATYPAEMIAELEGLLKTMTEPTGNTNEITWGLRQLTFVRRKQ